MYDHTGQKDASDKVQQYVPLVHRIAHHLSARLPANIQLEDLIQSGLVGLLDALKNYDPSKGASFETYAGIRIRGAMIDDMRKGDWVPRSVHRNARKISSAIETLEKRIGRDASDVEIAEEMGVSLAEYNVVLQDATSSRLFSIEELAEATESGLAEPNAGEEPEQDVVRLNFQQQLVDAIRELPEKERLVLSLYYYEELNLKEIGAVLEVSESRVSQIHSQAALRLRSRMSAWHNPN